MPRAKSKQALSIFMVRGHPLTDSEKYRLLELLGYDAGTVKAAETPGYRVLKRKTGAPLLVKKIPASEAPAQNPFDAILHVENALGLGIEGAAHLDSIPRPADYRQEFDRARRAAIPLIKIVTGWSDYYRDQFTIRGHDIHKIEQALRILFDVSIDVTREMAGKSSKGARKQTALTEVIRRLRHTFSDYYQGKRTKRKRHGAFQSLAQWKKDELAFVDTALLDARLVRKGHYDLPRLFRDPRCALAEERAETVERVA